MTLFRPCYPPLPLIMLGLLLLTAMSSLGEDVDDATLELILSGMQYYDALVESGQGDVIYRWFQQAADARAQMNYTYTYHLTFSGDKTRMGIPEQFNERQVLKQDGSVQKRRVRQPHVTHIVNRRESWTIRHQEGKPDGYAYSSLPNSSFYNMWDPRWILTRAWTREMDTGLHEYVRENGFQVAEECELDGTPCYLLTSDRGERLWVAPERGFRVLRYEWELALPGESPGLPQGTQTLRIRRISYQQSGEAWFPIQSSEEFYSLDEQGERHLRLSFAHETRNLQLNIPIPDEQFEVEIPRDARIAADGSTRMYSKAEFLKLHGLSE